MFRSQPEHQIHQTNYDYFIMLMFKKQKLMDVNGASYKNVIYSNTKQNFTILRINTIQNSMFEADVALTFV